MGFTYQDKPLPTDILSASQGDIRGNFDYLTATLGTTVKAGDHQISVGGNSLTNFEGRHLQVCLKNRVGSPPTIGGFAPDLVDSLIYSSNGNLFFGSANSAASVYKLTSVTSTTPSTNFGAANQGWTFIPGGLIINYGKITGQSGAWPASTQTVNFNAPNINFPSACFQVQATFIGPASSSTGDICIISVTAGNFRWAFTGSSSSSFDGFYWVAIGN